MCGKKLTDGISGLTGSGSPLHVQEKHFEDAVKICIRRITPACAGKTSLWGLKAMTTGDHPRVCGKNLLKDDFYFNRGGSPPRVREKLRNTWVRVMSIGITPACAGKTLYVVYLSTLNRDHPRVCGKNVFG